eukprot:465946-Lingulodinium_polyedra.AAC.1
MGSAPANLLAAVVRRACSAPRAQSKPPWLADQESQHASHRADVTEERAPALGAEAQSAS